MGRDRPEVGTPPPTPVLDENEDSYYPRPPGMVWQWLWLSAYCAIAKSSVAGWHDHRK